MTILRLEVIYFKSYANIQNSELPSVQKLKKKKVLAIFLNGII